MRSLPNLIPFLFALAAAVVARPLPPVNRACRRWASHDLPRWQSLRECHAGSPSAPCCALYSHMAEAVPRYVRAGCMIPDAAVKQSLFDQHCVSHPLVRPPPTTQVDTSSKSSQPSSTTATTTTVSKNAATKEPVSAAARTGTGGGRSCTTGTAGCCGGVPCTTAPCTSGCGGGCSTGGCTQAPPCTAGTTGCCGGKPCGQHCTVGTPNCCNGVPCGPGHCTTGAVGCCGGVPCQSTQPPATNPPATNPPATGNQNNNPNNNSGQPIGSDGVCLHGDGMVAVSEKSGTASKRVRDLVVGDDVGVGQGAYSRVFMFTHRDPEFLAAFLRLTVDAGNRTVTVTPLHVVHSSRGAVAAREVVVGDELALGEGGFAAVTKVEETVGRGVFNPQTMHGDIVVDGVRVSTYTLTVERRAAHGFLAPLRALYRISGWHISGVF